MMREKGGKMMVWLVVGGWWLVELPSSFFAQLWNVGRCAPSFVLLPPLDHQLDSTPIHQHWPLLLLLVHITLPLLADPNNLGLPIQIYFMY